MELFLRVKDLETTVETLEKRLNTMPITTGEVGGVNDDETAKITRNTSRQYVINKLKEVNPDYYIEKGNRASGADIVLIDKPHDGDLSRDILRNIKANFYHSKSYNQDYPSGWHTVKDTDISNVDIDFFVFNVEYNQEFSAFIFTKCELEKYVENKEMDQNNVYHFYFHIKQGKVVELRDSERDVENFLNRWDIVDAVLLPF